MMLHADRSEIDQFLAAIFCYADEGTFISLRAFDQFERGTPALFIEAIPINGSRDRLTTQAFNAAERAANAPRPAVFAPPVATFNNPRTARSEDIANGVALSVEIDATDPIEAQRRLEQLLGPVTMAVHSGGEWVNPETGELLPKTHLHWRLSEPTRDPVDHARLQDARWLAAVLVGADRSAAPSAHPLRWPGSWNRKATPRLALISTGNPASEVHLFDALEKLQEAVEASGLATPTQTPKASGDPQASLTLLAAALAHIPNANAEWDEWNRIGMAIWRASGGSPEGLKAWADWSATSTKHDEETCAGRWHHFVTSPPTKIGAGTIFHLAGLNGWVRPSPGAPVPPPEIDDPGYWNAVELDAPARPDPEETHEVQSARVLDPWNALRPVAFPDNAIPPRLMEFIENRSRIIGADPCAIAWAAISACSAAIDGRVRLQMKRHDQWSVAPAIWVALIGAPSTKKTPVIDAAWAPLHKVQSTVLKRYQAEMQEWKALPKDEKGATPEPQQPRRLISHDATMEALQDILSRQDRGIGVLRDELAGWIGAMEKYAPGKGGAADRAFALQSYNGGAHVVDRVGRGMLPINNLLTVMCGGIQPDRLRQFGDLTDDGLWQRFVPIIMTPAGIGTDEEADRSVTSYSEMVDRLLRIKSDSRLYLSEGAHSIREDVQRRIFHLEQSEVLGARFVGFCGKMVGLWGRLALVLHFMVNTTSLEVSATTAEAARTLLFRSILPNAARVYTAMGGAGGDVEATQSIAGYILTKRLDRIVMSDLTSNVRICRHRSLEEVRKLLSPLEAGGWLKPEKEFNPTSWLVSDFVHTKFADRAVKETHRRAAVRALITGNGGRDDDC